MKFDKFMQGFMCCLSATTQHGRDINTSDIEAWKVLGEPTNKELKDAGVEKYDIETATSIRKATK